MQYMNKHTYNIQNTDTNTSRSKLRSANAYLIILILRVRANKGTCCSCTCFVYASCADTHLLYTTSNKHIIPYYKRLVEICRNKMSNYLRRNMYHVASSSDSLAGSFGWEHRLGLDDLVREGLMSSQQQRVISQAEESQPVRLSWLYDVPYGVGVCLGSISFF